MFGNNKRLEEDLKRIERANMPEDKLKAILEQEAREEEKLRKAKESFTFTDIVAMVIAIFSIVLPYLLAFIGIMGAVMLALYFWLG